MKRALILSIIIILFSVSVNAQTKSKYGNKPGVQVKIVEDYSYPNRDMWEEKKYTVITKIENAMYVATAKDR